MRKPKSSKRPPRRQARLATTLATSAASMALLTATSGCGGIAFTSDPKRAGTVPAPSVRAQRQAPPRAADARISAQAALDKYFLEGYNHCDAEVLAAFWGEATPYDAKVRLGTKMLRWGSADADAHLPAARAKAVNMPLGEMPCWYADYGYSFEDAEVMAVYWQWDDISDAKLKMTRMLIKGKDAELRAALKDAKAERGAS